MRTKLIIFSLLYFSISSFSQTKKVGDYIESTSHKPESKSERTIQYTPDGQDFVCVNRKNKFTRALYGSHTGFRVETSDVPEFALYLPRMGGNLSFSVVKGNDTLQLNNAKYIKAIYPPGTRIYKISDPILGIDTLEIQAMALFNSDGAIWKISRNDNNIQVIAKYGGASYTRFSREGDLGVDPPDCFDLKPEYCRGNIYSIDRNNFELTFGKNNSETLYGTFPINSGLETNSLPVLFASFSLKKEQYIYIGRENISTENELKAKFDEAEIYREKLASQIQIKTPDPYLNTIGGALSVAADGIWDGQVWLHGAVGWRMPLTGWRAAYTGDFLGWHDRAKTHFDAYAKSQVTNVPQIYPHPAQDSALNLARAEKKWGTPMYSNGYICRNPENNTQMHHYDMNLVYIDELLWHLNWTGDLDYARKMWPTIALSLAWEKKNYDPNDDGLYDSYASIWASDALYYNSGAVTNSSAYNYRANKMAAEIAEKIGEDPAPYLKEAAKIKTALENTLWLPQQGHWAEFKDFMSNKRTHESAAVWTIYQAIDDEVGNAFQNYEATKYLDNEIPHIPVKAIGLKDENYETISTTNWLPYSWSINNVAFAEVMNTALAYFQAGRDEAGYKLLKSSVLDGMYLGNSPGNIGQISYYDAARGECYRDFGDPIGVASRVFVQGLFGINPDAMNKRMTIKPGFPEKWDFASIKTPDIAFSYKRNNNKIITETYEITNQIKNVDTITLEIPALSEKIKNLTLNEEKTDYKLIENSIEKPMISIRFVCGKNKANNIKIEWEGKNIEPETINIDKTWSIFDILSFKSKYKINYVYDPQEVLKSGSYKKNKFKGSYNVNYTGNHTFFVNVKSGEMTWWVPVNVKFHDKRIINVSDFSKVNSEKCVPVDLSKYYNAKVTDIFKNQYFSPRSPYTTLEIPTQGIGEWCHPELTAYIDDSGMRTKIKDGILKTSLGIPFKTPEKGDNIVFTSLWDNYPDSVKIPLSGNASNIYLLMAGSTNHMQCHIPNGEISIVYTDGTSEKSDLTNPETWAPIEQDFYVDSLAFKINTPPLYRLHFKTGIVSNQLGKDLHIKGVYGREIENGAGIIFNLPVNPRKELKCLTLKTISNDVLIGLISVTLQKE